MRDKKQKFTGNWLGRSLNNYKAQHAKNAKAKGVYAEFMATTTLTRARKILFGVKSGAKEDK